MLHHLPQQPLPKQRETPSPQSPSPVQMPSPSPQRILPQLISVLIQRHFSFNPTLLPSPLFPGFSSSLLSSLLSSLPRFFPTNSPASHPLPSLAFSFYSWAQSHCHFSHDEMSCRHMARLLVGVNSLPSLWLFLRNNEALVTTATVTALIATLGQHGLSKSALNLFYRMKQFHCKPDVQCYNTLISVLCMNRDFKKARFLLDQMELPGARCKPDLYTYTIFITFYCKRGLETGFNEADKALRFMREMEEREHGKPSSSSYTPIIHSLCESGRVNEARDLLVEMVARGHVPRDFTYKLVCGSLRSKGADDLSEEICWKIETGIRERIKQVMQVRPVEELERTGRFTIVSKDNGIPLVAFSLKDRSRRDEFELSHHLRRFAWIVPAYTIPKVGL
ncbi:hypothetical protein FCM35_KLT14867 [Carex littledalei]|uniref:Pentatricopeptide repeat-containing protein n=1 Tax=Carex littledalei TaxID=544730 RepID=A0A833QCK6_9POAL|nr:hypothetical protein FCM35_KLT14867 [Carex littledalei]